MDKKAKNTMIISVIALALVLIGVTYAYFSARITGLESASTISLTAGRMGIVYSEGNEEVTFTNIYPKEEAWATKTFTLTGYNTTDQGMYYKIGLNVITNTFTNDYLTYDLTLLSGTNGTPVASKTGVAINGTGKILFGMGSFLAADGDSHNYELKIYFKDNGLDQNDAQEAVFNAKIYVEESDGIEAPDGWKNAPAGSLLAGIKANNSSLSTMGTIPGKEPSASGLITKTVTEFCGGDSDCNVYYYQTFDDALNYTNGSSGNYSEVYGNLIGKWTWDTGAYYVVTNATASSITYTNVERIQNLESNLLLSEEDDYGTSYYYRGAASNNYLVFANMCWRIVRIDGQGNTKITLYNYNPTNSATPCDASLDAAGAAFARYDNTTNGQNGKSKFNTNYNKNTYVGYMYSNNPDSTDYNIAHANDNDSTILTNLKAWYDLVFSQTDKDKLADVIWCNDKRVVSDTTYDPWNWGSVSGTGIGTDRTFYQADRRLMPTSEAVPSLKCGISKTDNLISKFTASTTTDGGYGNGKLNGYKIGLLTSDEIAFAGAIVGSGNSTYYLYKNANGDASSWYWTLSPSDFFGGYAGGSDVDGAGLLGPGAVNDVMRVRPAVSLKSTVSISSGTGTQSNPFIVQ